LTATARTDRFASYAEAVTESSQTPPTAETMDDPLLAALGIEVGGSRHGELAAACAPIVRRIRADGLRVIGFIPSDDKVAVPPLLIQLGLALSEATGNTVAVVDANVRYPGLPSAAKDSPTIHDQSVFSTRWLRGQLALISPPHAERAGQVVPQLARVLIEGAELFGHVLVDLTGFELLGEHATAAACMDAVALVGRAHQTHETDLVGLADLMPKGRFLGVLLVG